MDNNWKAGWGVGEGTTIATMCCIIAKSLDEKCPCAQACEFVIYWRPLKKATLAPHKISFSRRLDLLTSSFIDN